MEHRVCNYYSINIFYKKNLACSRGKCVSNNSSVIPVYPTQYCSYTVRVSGSYKSQRLHSSTQHTRRQIHRGGSNTREEAHDGFNAAWMTCVPQSFESDDHVCLIAILQTFHGHIQQWLVQMLNKHSEFSQIIIGVH